jgi:hypothetical protein
LSGYLKKRYKLEIDRCVKKTKGESGKREREKGKGEKDKGKQGENKGKTRGSMKKNKAAILLPY